MAVMNDTRDNGRDPGEVEHNATHVPHAPERMNDVPIEQERAPPLPDPGALKGTIEAQIEAAQPMISDWSRGEIPMVETREARGEFLSATLSSNRFAEHASRVMEIVLETVTASTESLWRPSPAELHDLMRARDEQAETRAIVAADRQHAAALDEANWHINHNRNHARTDDGARQAEDAFDRYPGLTQDVGADETRARENDRAFYDTGIERGR
jgi:hypothetical protein